jgi:DNA replication and repair protein RecF
LKVRQIQFVHFRNHRAFTFEPGDGLNIIYGSNGSGKTTILEGIHYCALTKSFLSIYDSEFVTYGKTFFLINGLFVNVKEKLTSIKVTYSRDTGKQVSVNTRNVPTFSEHVGTVPCITFSPADILIVNGAPAERRRFLDKAISQMDVKYLQALIQYRRLLQQRNALLLLIRDRQADQNVLDILTEQLVEKAAIIVYARREFIEGIMPCVISKLRIVSGGENPSLTYRCTFQNDDDVPHKDSMANHLLGHLKARRSEEIARGQTAAGPHRDDILFALDEKEIKKYASQGQKRTFIISLKLALYDYFQEHQKEKPICLLDDLFSELDSKRVSALLSILADFGQTLITSTEKRTASYINSVNIHDLI